METIHTEIQRVGELKEPRQLRWQEESESITIMNVVVHGCIVAATTESSSVNLNLTFLLFSLYKLAPIGSFIGVYRNVVQIKTMSFLF